MFIEHPLYSENVLDAGGMGVNKTDGALLSVFYWTIYHVFSIFKNKLKLVTPFRVLLQRKTLNVVGGT